MSEPQQGLAYEEILALARTAEDGWLRERTSDPTTTRAFPAQPDCRLPTPGRRSPGSRARRRASASATLVSPVTFRSPGNLAKIVTTVDEMSGGRVELGLGAGWNDLEHAQHGLRFPEQRERFDMLEEQLAIVHGLWTEPDGWSFDGAHWQVSDAHFAPRPVARAGRRHPNIIVGGHGGPRLAAWPRATPTR